MTDKVRMLLTQALSLLEPMEPVPLADEVNTLQLKQQIRELQRTVDLLTDEKERYRSSYISLLEEKTRLNERLAHYIQLLRG